MTDLEQSLLEANNKLIELYSVQANRIDQLMGMLVDYVTNSNHNVDPSTPINTETIVQVPDSQQLAGRVPWKKQQQILERRYAKKPVQDEYGKPAENPDTNKDEPSYCGQSNAESRQASTTTILQKEKEVC